MHSYEYGYFSIAASVSISSIVIIAVLAIGFGLCGFCCHKLKAVLRYAAEELFGL